MEYSLLPLAALLHVIDEYFFPGGFVDAMSEVSPRFGGLVTPAFAVIINGLFVLLCCVAAASGRKRRFFGQTVLGLILANSVAHVGGTIRLRRYNPGLATAVLLYVPLALSGYRRALASGESTPVEVAGSIAVGASYHAVPLVSLLVLDRLKVRASRDDDA
jgi:hypothetical protein